MKQWQCITVFGKFFNERQLQLPLQRSDSTMFPNGCLKVAITLSIFFLLLHVKTSESMRLPANLTPTLYELHMQPHLEAGEKEFTFEGEVTIHFKCLNDTEKVVLNSKNLTVLLNKVTVFRRRHQEIHPIPIKSHKFETWRDFYIIHVGTKLRAGHTYQIYIQFSSVLQTNPIGFYRASYIDSQTNATRWIATTQFEPIEARSAFPCFDEPSYKARFDVKITRPKEMTALSNMPLKRTVPVEGEADFVTDAFERSLPMSTYLVAFIVSDYVHVESLDKKFRVWSTRDTIDKAKYALQIGPKIQDYFAEYFSFEFPLPKQDLISIPNFFYGAMENFGLITFREINLLYDNDESSDESQMLVAKTVAHELSHQWFGNLVTMRWYNGLWLKEGLSTYMEYLGVEAVQPEWRILDLFPIYNFIPVFEFDKWNSSHPILAKADTRDDIYELFDSISYKKGGSLIRMMSHFLTESVLRLGLSHYLNTWKYNSTTEDDLWKAIAEKVGEGQLPGTLNEIMDSWTSQVGIPVVHVKRHYHENDSVTFSQERFVFQLHDNVSSWWIPISYSTPKENFDFSKTEPTFWLEKGEKDKTVQIPANSEEWIIANVQHIGLFHVNYDTKNWELIAAQLKKDFKSIHILNRAQIIFDAFALAKKSFLSYDLAFEISKFIHHDEDFTVWEVYLRAMRKLYNLLELTPAFGRFKAFMRKQLEPQYLKLGLHENDTSENLQEKMLRVSIVSESCNTYEIHECREQAKAMFADLMKLSHPIKENRIPKNFRQVVYCQGVKFGGLKAWNFLWGLFKRTKSAVEQNSMLAALGCTPEQWILSRYLNATITPEDQDGVSEQFSTNIFKAVSSKTLGSSLTLGFIHDHWETILARLGKASLARMADVVENLSAKIVSDSGLKQFEILVLGKDFGPATLNVNQAVERIKTNIAWMKTHYQDLANLLSAE